MQVAVIGAGVIGTCTAYFLAAAGHQVVVLERYGNVAQEASFANAGLVSPGLAGPLVVPGAPRGLAAWLSRPETPVAIRPEARPALWRWLRRWNDESGLDQLLVNKERAQRLTRYSQLLLAALRDHHQLPIEQTTGILQLFRTPREQQMAEPFLELLAEGGVAHRHVDPDAARQIEPALSDATPLAGAILLPADESGNCALFTRQMRTICQDAGVEFHFNSEVGHIAAEANRVRFRIEEREFSADALVIAAGAQSGHLLGEVAPALPLFPVTGFSATANIRNYDGAPLAAVYDDSCQVAITRIGNRVRIAGGFQPGRNDTALDPSALAALIKCGEDWFPDASNYNNASFWSGACATLPDGVPVLGKTAAPNVLVNIAHGRHGFAMAAGAAKITADLLSGQEPEIDINGLTLARYG